MYKEFRELSRADAVKSLYQDMAARHRARFRSIHVRLAFFRRSAFPLVDDTIADSPRCRDRKDCRRAQTIHQAAFGTEPQVPSSTSGYQTPLKICCPSPKHLLVGLFWYTSQVLQFSL